MENKIFNTGAKLQQMATEDVFNLLTMLVETVRNSSSFKRMESEIKECGWNSIGTIKVNEDVYPNLMKELRSRDILYTSWSIEGTNKICVFYNPEYTEDIKSIMSSIKVRVGLEIDSKDELEAIISLEKDKNNKKMISVNGLNPLVAEKAIQLSQKLKTPIVIVKNKEADGTLSLHSKINDQKIFSQIISEAAMSLSGISGKYEASRLEAVLQEQGEIDYIKERVLADKEIDTSYIFSTVFPSNYIKVETGYFEVHNGDKVKVYSQDSNPENYYEILKFKINRLDNPVVYPANEVEQSNGPQSKEMFEKIREEKAASYFGEKNTFDIKKDAHIINFEKKYEYWLMSNVHPDKVLTARELKSYTDTYSPSMFMNEKSKDLDIKDEKSISSFETLKRGHQDFSIDSFIKNYEDHMKDIELKSTYIDRTNDFEIMQPEKDIER